MKKVSKVLLAVILAMSFCFACMPAFAAEGITETAYNNGKTTDFVDTWGQGNMSSVIDANGNTVVEIGIKDGAGYGTRMVNNYTTNLKTFAMEAKVFVPKQGVGFIAFTTGQGGYIQVQPALTFAFLQGLKADGTKDENKTTLVIGRDHTSGTIALDDKDDPAETQSQADADLISEIELDYAGIGEMYINALFAAAIDGGLTLSIDFTNDSTANGQEIVISKDKLIACTDKNLDGTAVTEVNPLVGGWQANTGEGVDKTNVKVTFINYIDSYRTAYLVDQAEAIAAFTADVATAKTKADALTASSSITAISQARKECVAVETELGANFDIRNYEKGVLLNKTGAMLATIDGLTTDTNKKDLIKISSYVDYLHDLTANDAIKNKLDADKAESVKQLVDYDKLMDLESAAVGGVDAIKDKYIVARDILAAEKDAFVLVDIVAYEVAVTDLSTNEKIVEAADLKSIVKIDNALRQNKDTYKVRLSAANAKLSTAMKTYAGDISKNWDVYNVTFVKADNGAIKYSGSDYYDDDTESDMGISFKKKFVLDGFSAEFTIDDTSFKDAWIGFHFFSDLGVMRISDKGDIKASTGITTLIVPGAENTEFQMGYPKLYGNCPPSGWTKHPFGTVGARMKIEFKKEGTVYKSYVTVGDGEKLLIREMDAEALEKVLPNGEGYFNLGSCDKWGEGFKITLHKINGINATEANLGQIPDPEGGGENETPEDKPKDEAPVTTGCGGCGATTFGGGTLALIFITVAAIATIFVIRTKKSNKKQ